jgi:hypothetical protein
VEGVAVLVVAVLVVAVLAEAAVDFQVAAQVGVGK